MLVPPVSGARHDVIGLQLGLVTDARSLYGLQLGFIWGVLEADSGPLQLALFGTVADKDFAGLQAGLCVAHCGGDIDGLQLSGVRSSARRMRGIQLSVMESVAGAGGNLSLTLRKPDPRGELAARLESLGIQLSDASRGLPGESLASFDSLGPESAGIQVGGAWATASGCFSGIQIAGLDASSEHLRGVAAGAFCSSLWVEGVQAGAITQTVLLEGVQVGAFNQAQCACGLQIGLVNYARTLRGMQIGLLNVSGSRALPFVNISF